MRHNRRHSIYQYSNMVPGLSGQPSIFGTVFCVSKSLLGIVGQKKFTILTVKLGAMLEYWHVERGLLCIFVFFVMDGTSFERWPMGGNIIKKDYCHLHLKTLPTLASVASWSQSNHENTNMVLLSWRQVKESSFVVISLGSRFKCTEYLFCVE